MQGELLDTTRASQKFAKVALPIPVDKPFTYSIPDALAADLFVGRRVEVPFGRRVLSGVVTELTDQTDVPRVKPIRGLFETFLPDELLNVSRWIADYYGCTLGEAVQSVLPPSLKRAKVKARPTGNVRVLDEGLRRGGVTGDAFAGVQKKLSRAKKQLALLSDLISAGGEELLTNITGEWGYSRTIVDGLAARRMVAIEAVQPHSPLTDIEAVVGQLNAEQTDALARVVGMLESGGFHPALLYGVTGSGKTEVYLRAAREVIDGGGGVIVLVPEIGLLPQATARYRRVFGDTVAIIHSRLTGPERFDIWEKVQRGDYRIVVGPRSAIFSPVTNLRMIIVDEEQDDSYKQDDKPRYHARNVALMRGKLEGLTVVLGSATPSAESLRQAIDGNYASLRLRDRAAGAPLPEIRLIDMRKEEDKSTLFSQRLTDAIEENIRRGHQTIVFLNKRGHARYVQCNACGWVARCRHCDISLTYHRVDNTLKCHFCGFTRPSVSRCDECKGSRLFFSGVGTQRVELELNSLFPGAQVLRMDADTTSGKGGHQRILEEFSTGSYPILLGTQMVTKGHHFPGVSLVGVLSAEEGLNFPDFRSAERTFQQLTQVAGRSGRGSEPGRVLIQTYMPEHHVFQFLKKHDYDGFMGEELAVRKALRYPPFARLVLASASAANPLLLNKVMQLWAGRMRERLQQRPVEILGPAPPLVARVKDRHREQILLKGRLTQDDKNGLLGDFREVVESQSGASKLDLRWDVDPESFL